MKDSYEILISKKGLIISFLIFITIFGCSFEILQTNTKSKQLKFIIMKEKVITLEEQPMHVENKESKKITPIEDTPFAVVEYDEQYFLAFGRYRLTGLYDSYEEAEALAKSTDWEVLLRVMYAVAREVLLDRANDSLVQETEEKSK